jgi:hypothetical protein
MRHNRAIVPGAASSRSRCAEVCCLECVPSGPQEGFPAERPMFLGDPNEAGSFCRSLDHLPSGAGMRCGVRRSLIQPQGGCPCISPAPSRCSRGILLLPGLAHFLLSTTSPASCRIVNVCTFVESKAPQDMTRRTPTKTAAPGDAAVRTARIVPFALHSLRNRGGGKGWRL